MRLGILHLSDIHFKIGKNSVLERADRIFPAVRAEIQGFDGCLLVASGDIAYSGNSAEYELAQRFFKGIQAQIENETKPGFLDWAFAPGNHDCNFDNDNKLRRGAIANMTIGASPIEDGDHSIVDQCTRVQSEFFKFLGGIAPPLSDLIGPRRMEYGKKTSLAGINIRLQCYNTAWISQQKEKQSSLWYPPSLVPRIDDGSDIVVSIFHHPYNWLENGNAHAFRKAVEQTSDIILTGHEHESEIYERQSVGGDAWYYVEGSVLQADDEDVSGFNLVVVDAETKCWRASQFEWDSKLKLYAEAHACEWRPFHRSSLLRYNSYSITKTFSEALDDPGANFTHPRTKTLKLSDVFVYPDLTVRDLERDKERDIKSGSVADFAVTEPYLFIVGPDRAGKTSLTKVLYRAFLDRGVVPVLIDGFTLNSRKSGSFTEQVATAVESQFGREHVTRYAQLEPESKAVIIDDLHLARLNNRNRMALLDELVAYSRHVILLAGDAFDASTLSSGEGGEPFLIRFKRCAIRPLGHFTRGEIVRKWHRLNSEDSDIDEIDIDRNISVCEQTLNAVLRKKLLPPYPIFVLTILQLMESQINPSAFSGAYGYVYEALITAALTKVWKVSSLDTCYTFLSLLAFHMYRTGTRVVGTDEVNSVSEELFKRHKIRISSEEFLRELHKAGMLTYQQGQCRFRYKYLYFYFVAKYIDRYLSLVADGPGFRNEIHQLVLRIYNEDAANILIVFVYLSKDLPTISDILARAEDVFRTFQSWNVETEIPLICEPEKSAPEFAYTKRDPDTVRKEVGRALDDLDYSREDQGEETEERPERDGPATGAAAINEAFKMIEVLGQILRSSPASLDGDTKHLVARESYRVGLRLLSFFFNELTGNAKEIRETLLDSLSQKYSSQGRSELTGKVDRICFVISMIITYAVIKSISFSVGSEELRETFKDVLAETQTPTFAIVDLSIKLDHYRSSPEGDVLKLKKRFRSNPFAMSLLQVLALEYMYLHKCTRETVQNLCDVLEITLKDYSARILEGGKKDIG